jgi:hypothetical protein
MTDWQPIETSPRDGSEFEVLIAGDAAITVKQIRWARFGMDKDLSLCGRNNRLSPYLTATHWRADGV